MGKRDIRSFILRTKLDNNGDDGIYGKKGFDTTDYVYLDSWHVASLLSATEDQVGECRKFIRQYCDPEYLSVYDIYWAGNDDRRLEKLAELQEEATLKEEGLEL